MAVSSLSRRTTVSTTASAQLEVIAPAEKRVKLIEMQGTLVSGTVSGFGLGRPQAIGVAPVLHPMLSDNPANGSSAVNVANAWTTTAPTVPLIFRRRVVAAAIIGEGWIWSFPFGLVIPISGSVVLWNLQASSLLDVHVTVEE